MLVMLKPCQDKLRVDELIARLRGEGVAVSSFLSGGRLILSLSGDLSRLDHQRLASHELVDEVKLIEKPWPFVSRDAHPQDTVVHAGGVSIGAGSLTLMAGPCTVEGEEQLLTVASAVKDGGAVVLRGGAFKPRTSPYAFQGLGSEGIRLLSKAKQATGLPVISEIMEPSQLPLFEDVDIIQVGARNMQNYCLLRELGRQPKPVMIKRGLSATYDELMMSAEYVMAEGNGNVILCERGIRTFEQHTRCTLDIAAVPVLKKLTHLPVVVDPSHAAGHAEYVGPLAMAAVSAGADGVLIEVHSDPAHALCDGVQALQPSQFAQLAQKLLALHSIR